MPVKTLNCSKYRTHSFIAEMFEGEEKMTSVARMNCAPRNFNPALEMIEAGAAGVHFEDQLSSAKKCGHMGGKVLAPTGEFIQKLTAARLAADVMDAPTILIARTDANSATLLTSDIVERDRAFLTGERAIEGFYRVTGGLDQAIARGLAYAPYADLIWCETSEPDLDEAREFAEAIHAEFPGKLMAYNCSPSSIFYPRSSLGFLLPPDERSVQPPLRL